MNAQLETILRRYLVLVPEGQDVPLETELPALGLDSMSALTLLLELEEIFDISFPDSLLNATTFRSAKSLENVIQMLRKERDGHGRHGLGSSIVAGTNRRRLEMRVTDARLIRLRDSCQLEAWVTLESMQSDPFLLWYRFPLDYITAVSVGLNDAFVAALLTPAMALGERLRIEGVGIWAAHAVPASIASDLPRMERRTLNHIG